MVRHDILYNEAMPLKSIKDRNRLGYVVCPAIFINRRIAHRVKKRNHFK